MRTTKMKRYSAFQCDVMNPVREQVQRYKSEVKKNQTKMNWVGMGRNEKEMQKRLMFVNKVIMTDDKVEKKIFLKA